MDVLCRTGQARRGAPLRHCLPFLHGSPGTKLRQLVSAACRFGQRTRSTYALRVGCNTGSQEACLGAAAPTWHVRWLQDQWVLNCSWTMQALAILRGGQEESIELWKRLAGAWTWWTPFGTVTVAFRSVRGRCRIESSNAYASAP